MPSLVACVRPLKGWLMIDWCGIWKPKTWLQNSSQVSEIQEAPIDHLVRLETYVREAFVKKEHLTAIFFDLEKDYETTWNYGIKRDLCDLQLKGRMPDFICNFLSDRYFQVRIGDKLSAKKKNKKWMYSKEVFYLLPFLI